MGGTCETAEDIEPAMVSVERQNSRPNFTSGVAPPTAARGQSASRFVNPDPRPSPKRRPALQGDLLLLAAAVIWGGGFVAQREASTHIGPLTFNAFRNLIAIVALLPAVLRWGRHQPPGAPGPVSRLAAGTIAGLTLFAGSWLQQAGVAHTTAGNAGFITGLYVVLVPVLAALGGARIPRVAWPAAGLATLGMYLLGATADWTLGRGDALVLGSAGFWSVHVLLVGRYAPRMNGLWLAWIQMAVTALLSLPLAAGLETIAWPPLRAALVPLLYAGVMGGALAFSFQVFGQRRSPPAHAAILMSLESVFAAIFGWLLLGEHLGPRGLLGAVLMLAGMFVSQWPQIRPRPASPTPAP